MIEIKPIGVWGFEGAIRGMRMPYESFNKSDSARCRDMRCEECPFKKENIDCVDNPVSPEPFIIGNADMELCRKLIKAGSEHRKFMRMIHVQADVLAPRYWWVEADKYKWIEANSSSTMHLIAKKELSVADFSIDYNPETRLPYERVKIAIDNLHDAIEEYKRDKEEGCDLYVLNMDFRIIKQLLPESYNQLRMIDTNYECLLNIYHQRKNHRLREWYTFCRWCLTLPYFKEFVDAMEE